MSGGDGQTDDDDDDFDDANVSNDDNSNDHIVDGEITNIQQLTKVIAISRTEIIIIG